MQGFVFYGDLKPAEVRALARKAAELLGDEPSTKISCRTMASSGALRSNFLSYGIVRLFLLSFSWIMKYV